MTKVELYLTDVNNDDYIIEEIISNMADATEYGVKAYVVDEVDIGEWQDDHISNYRATTREQMAALFKK